MKTDKEWVQGSIMSAEEKTKQALSIAIGALNSMIGNSNGVFKKWFVKRAQIALGEITDILN